MGLLEKLETLINNLLIHLGNLFMRLLLKIISPKVQQFFITCFERFTLFMAWLKNLPSLIIKKGPSLLIKAKSIVLSFNYKEKLNETYKAALAQYVKSQPGSKVSKVKTTLLAPFLILGQWLKGLTSAQALLLLGFTSASGLAGINMIFSAQRLMNQNSAESRAPASIEEEVSYDRPSYYKKQARHLSITSLKLPVYMPKLNEIRSIDIDFSATMSSRMSRMKLAKMEFELRDHLILNVEPMVASFPLEEEGKEILRKKLTLEINDFMIANKIEGQVQEIKLIYILGN